ncbi:MAG TPA: peptide synthase [Thiotrichaceae bacterium]|jgi:acyl-CoA synthetase (AMP-forming)/AMP-acid ligase II|nr:peptide synthase [Thiotrichaceae bacterium]HIM07709.1 peptide synthase [Gammaproteobacteria bacterium]
MITANIASHLPVMAKKQADTYAVVKQNKSKNKPYDIAYTYKQLDETSDLIANGLEEFGIKKGTRTVLMVKPGLDFFALVFALFKLEAVLVAVDPGMGIKNLGKCLQEAEPEAFIGNATAHSARLALRWSKKTIRKTVLVGSKSLLNLLVTDLNKIKKLGKTSQRKLIDTKAEDIAAILFTSGSTGVPKGVVYTYANFTAQVDALKQLYNIQPGEIDLATFPLFALFSPALGMTSIIPMMDFTKPGSVDPKNIIDAITQYKCTNMFGSPALLNRVGKWAENKGLKLDSLKRVLSAGAPVAPSVLNRFQSLLNNNAQIFTPYGATESLPISSIGSKEILKETAKDTANGKGVCVGQPVSNLDMRIIKLNNDVISEWSDELELPVNKIGEICVKGSQVTRTYFNRNKATALAKIRSEDGFYHRMGDVGYIDGQDRLWFCGRKNQCVITKSEILFTICCEGIFNAHPFVFRTALVGARINGEIIPVICVELEQEHKRFNKADLIQELMVIGSSHPETRNIKHILFHSGFPVDIRHNAKIGRESLSKWATEELR